MAENPEAASETTTSQNDQQPTEIEVDGEKVSLQDAVTALKNKAEWQKQYTLRDQELAGERKRVNNLLEKAIDASQKPEAPPAPAPDPVEDREAFEAYQNKRQAETIAQAEAKAREIASQAERRVLQNQHAERQVQENKAMANRYIEQNFSDISPQEKDSVVRELGHLGGPQYGSLDKQTNVFIYNEKAVEKAARMVDSIHGRQIAQAQAEARQEGLTGRAQGQSAANAAPPARPPADATISDKVSYLNSLPPSQQSAAVQGMDADEIGQLIAQNRQNIMRNG